MKKVKFIIPIIIVIVGISLVLFDTANETVEDIIYQQASIDNTSPIETIIGKVEDDDITLYLYWTKDNRLGYATIKTNNSIFNKYSLCSVENVDINLLTQQKEIIKNYDEQQLNFTYGIVVEPESTDFVYNKQKYELRLFDCESFTVGVFVYNNI